MKTKADATPVPNARHYALVAFAALCVGYHIYLIFSGLWPNLLSRPLHLAMALPWVYIIGTARDSRIKKYSGYFLCAVGMAGCAYVSINRDMLSDQYGFISDPLQMALGVGLIVVVLEMARRVVKLALPCVAALAMAYGLFGQYLPGEFGHGGIPPGSLIGTLTIAEGGLWGPLTGVSVNVVAVFVILGAFMGAGEGGTAFMALATKLAGRYKAGAAKVSVLSSAFFGSISGSASANVASTGAITLPAMKRLGYPSEFAAAVEAVASSGGQIMPPLMGAGAFVMVELLGMPYTEIMEAALLPAILFFAGTWIGVNLFADRYGLHPMDRKEIPTGRMVRRLAPFFIIPFSLLLGFMLLSGYTPQFAAGIAIFASAVLLVTNEKLECSPGLFTSRLTTALVNGANQIAMIASIIICAGIVIGVLNMTGLGVKITSIILGMAGGNLWIALLLTAMACLVLGMEVPTTAAYVICVSVAGPALQKLGLPELHAHLFVFWYALLSTITPPVCGTVFIAAGMAQTPWIPVAGQAMRLGLGLYFVPLAMVANPALILMASHPLWALLAFAKTGLGLWLLSISLISELPLYQKLLISSAGIATIFLLGVGA
jgi:TRAP transporter 4TM/12TM fusion protein